MTDFPVRPRHMALLNVDLQNCFVEGYPISAPDGLALVARINRLAQVCRSLGIPVIHTRHLFAADASDYGVLAEIKPESVAAGYTMRGRPSAELHPALVVETGDLVFDKPRFGAFHGTDLEARLRSQGIDTLIVTGIATNVCCETTAREAMVRDFRVFFMSDGTATHAMGGLGAAELQRATLATLRSLFAQVLTVDAMIGKLEVHALAGGPGTAG